jgi:hypothetical protein
MWNLSRLMSIDLHGSRNGEGVKNQASVMKNILRNDEAPQDLALAEDLVIPGEWLVEYFDDDGADYVTIFTGQEAEARARDYRDALKEGRLGTRIADARWHGPNSGAE